jgi:hypothetical protein
MIGLAIQDNRRQIESKSSSDRGSQCTGTSLGTSSAFVDGELGLLQDGERADQGGNKAQELLPYLITND